MISTHCGLVMPYSDIDLDKDQLRYWLVVWRHQPMLIYHHHQRCSVAFTWQQSHKMSSWTQFIKCSEITCLISQPHIPGAKEIVISELHSQWCINPHDLTIRWNMLWCVHDRKLLINFKGPNYDIHKNYSCLYSNKFFHVILTKRYFYLAFCCCQQDVAHHHGYITMTTKQATLMASSAEQNVELLQLHDNMTPRLILSHCWYHVTDIVRWNFQIIIFSFIIQFNCQICSSESHPWNVCRKFKEISFQQTRSFQYIYCTYMPTYQFRKRDAVNITALWQSYFPNGVPYIASWHFDLFETMCHINSEFISELSQNNHQLDLW